MCQLNLQKSPSNSVFCPHPCASQITYFYCNPIARSTIVARWFGMYPPNSNLSPKDTYPSISILVFTFLQFIYSDIHTESYFLKPPLARRFLASLYCVHRDFATIVSYHVHRGFSWRTLMCFEDAKPWIVGHYTLVMVKNVQSLGIHAYINVVNVIMSSLVDHLLHPRGRWDLCFLLVFGTCCSDTLN